MGDKCQNHQGNTKIVWKQNELLHFLSVGLGVLLILLQVEQTWLFLPSIVFLNPASFSCYCFRTFATSHIPVVFSTSFLPSSHEIAFEHVSSLNLHLAHA